MFYVGFSFGGEVPSGIRPQTSWRGVGVGGVQGHASPESFLTEYAEMQSGVLF